MAKNPKKLTVQTLTHDEATRKNISTAEYQSVVAKEVESPIRVFVAFSISDPKSAS